MNTSIFIINKDKEIAETNFFETDFNHMGLLYLSYNERCFQLLIPTKLEKEIVEMRTGKYAVLTVGFHLQLLRDMAEIMFEDFSSAPFSISLSQGQMAYIIDKTFNNHKMTLKGYSEKGKVLEMDIYIRSGSKYQLPYLQPINIKQFTAA